MTFAEWVGLAANAVTICGIGFVVVQMKRDGSYASASVVMTICANIRTTIGLVKEAAQAGDMQLYDHRCRDLLNELELAAAVVLDGAASARTGKIAEHLLVDVLKAVRETPTLTEILSAAIHADSTFQNLRDFLVKRQHHFR